MRAEESLQRTVADYLARCVPPPPDGPWWTAVNPIAAKSRADAESFVGPSRARTHLLTPARRWAHGGGATDEVPFTGRA